MNDQSVAVKCKVIMHKIWAALALLISMPSIAAERYVVPIWGEWVRGANAMYTGTIAMTNLGDGTANVKVTKIVPMLTEACSIPCRDTEWTISPGGSGITNEYYGPSITLDGIALTLGAVELESDRPLHIASEIYGLSTPGNGSVQPVEIARDWITGESMIPRGMPVFGSFRLCLVNPNDFPIRIGYRSDRGSTRDAEVPANTCLLIDVGSDFGCPGGCSGFEQPVGMGRSLYLHADFPYLAASMWSVRSAVRVAQPFTKSQ